MATVEDQQLEDAIRARLAALGADDGTLTDWIVIAAVQKFDEDGDLATQVATVFPDGTMPYHRIIGLIEHARIRYHAKISGHDRDDD
jgi:hypothetical protein